MANNKVNTTVIPADVFAMMTNQDKKEYDTFLLNVYGSLIGGVL